MDDALRSRLHDLTLAARKLLTEEVRSLLTAVYGLSAEGRFESVSKLPAVQSLPEAADTRKRLERSIRDEVTAGRSDREAVEHLVKETAFTHLNRLVAFKLLEARRLMRGAIDRHHASNGFLFYLNDHPDDHACYEAGDLPQDALGEGPRDLAYRNFLLWQDGELAREVRVLFDPANLPSRLFPRPRVLRELIEALNAPELRDAWAIGNEETIGWVYQYFNEQEKAEVFERLNKQKQKIRREDLPAATQLFTPRWIVRFLVENTLGRQWLQMHPDSRLAEQMEYIVPLAGEIPSVPLKPVRELTLLDHACGTMHFGLVAFDLFAAMYREEGERAGEPGWPTEPSVEVPDDIPAAILHHNLYGIDIDLRAVQLATLCLYIRAKSLSPKVIIELHNFAYADISVLNGERLDNFVKLMEYEPASQGAVRFLWPLLKRAGEFGSLLRLENDLRDQFVPPKMQRRNNGTPSMPVVEEAEPGRFHRLGILDQQMRAALNDFARQEAARGVDPTPFVAGAEQGLKLFNLLDRRYDVVVANPPYLDSRDYEDRLKKFIDTAYPEGKRNLYSAFMLRSQELLAMHGRLGMITPLSFMFLSSFEGLRQNIRIHSAVETLVHTGYRTFANVMVDCAFFTLRHEPVERRRQESIGTYFRLVREPDAEAKRSAFERAVTELRRSDAAQRTQRVANVYRYRQGDFDAIPGAPWVYWITPTLRQSFVDLPKLNEISPAIHGTATYDNFRFLRYWWEIGVRNIASTSRSWQDFEKSNKNYVHYMKGGSFRRWYGNQEYTLQLTRKGKSLIEFLNEKRDTIRGQHAIFSIGITWSDLTQGRFAARLSPGGFIFDVKGSSAFPAEDEIPLVLALLNSEFAHYALNLLNPTISFQVGDLARLPIPTRTSETLNGLVKCAIALAKQDSVESETTYDFIAPPAWPTGTQDIAARHAELAAVERAIDEEVYRLYDIEGADRKAIEAELSAPPANDDDAPASEDGDEQLATDNKQPTVNDLARCWLSYALGVALGRFQPGVESAIGCGRFSPEIAARLRALADEDGIGLIEPGHPDDLGARIERALELMVGEDAAHTLIATATGGKSLHAYLTGEFYKEHTRQYRKRPVYWLLQSPGRKYSLLLFHERLTGDSLPLILGNRYLQGKINELNGRISEIQAQISAAAPGREKRQAERERDVVTELLTDAEEFTRLIRAVIERPNERGERTGWRPEIDDGVLINLAPLATLTPAWAAEPKKCWQALDRGDYDWSHTAMRYWPDRALAKCRTNKSYAIAHGVAVE